MAVPQEIRAAAMAAWRTRLGHDLAAVEFDSATDVAAAPLLLDVRQVTFRSGLHESYLVVFTAASGPVLCCFALPGSSGTEVTAEAGASQRTVGSTDRHGFAIFTDLGSGPVRFTYVISTQQGCRHVQTEWVLLRRPDDG
jgi:hypothetical protein